MIKSFFQKNVQLSIVIVICIVVLLLREQQYKENISRVLLSQSSVDNIYTSNLLFTIEDTQKLYRLFYSTAIQDIMSYGDKENQHFKLDELDFLQQVRLCRGYNESINDKYLELYEQAHKETLGTKQSLLNGLKELNKICTSKNVTEFKTK